jgi:hypothetical protein
VVSKPSIGAASVLEKMVIHGRRGPRAVGLAQDMLRLPVFEIVPPGGGLIWRPRLARLWPWQGQRPSGGAGLPRLAFLGAGETAEPAGVRRRRFCRNRYSVGGCDGG